MLPPFARKYLLTALSGTPDVLERLLRDLPARSPQWDTRPDPERFTLREIVAHLADWNPIFHERIQRTLREDRPTLPDIDEGALALERDYAHSDPMETLARFRETRAALMQTFLSLQEDAWQREALRPPIGVLSIEAHATLILGHDGYHTQQVAQWLATME